jgi:uncharacterized protein involved in exopolysaccharide biosynthesis
MRLTSKIVATVAVVAFSVAGAGSAFALTAEPCPEGYKGVIIDNNGQQTSVCQNFIK